MGKARWQLRNYSDELGDLQVALRNALFEVAEVAEAIKQVEKVAAGYGCVISQDGKVAWRDATSVQTESYRHGADANLERMLARAIALADSADSALNQKLSSFGTAPGKEPTKPGQIRDLSQAEQERFKNMSPEERAEYWSAQSDEQKRHLCDTYPELIGNADGVEAWARDRANRLNLDAKEARAREDLARYEGYWTKARTNEDRYLIGEKIQRAKSDLAAYEKIRSTLANGISLEDHQHGKQGEPVSLLTLQDDGRRVKAAVAQGDVDHAKHIATFVPGIGTTVEGSLHKYIRQAGNLRQAAADQGNMPISDVATVAWLGYDAPPGEVNPVNLGYIASPKLAQAGSDRLASFLTGMQASRQVGAGDAHMTLVGHSYGSTTSGMAATKVKYGVIDDLVLFGSPGMGTYDANDYRVDRNHLWVSGVPRGDGVQGIGAHGIGPVGHMGKNPMDPDSGFTHLSDDATGAPNYNRDAPPSDTSLNFDNHSI